MRELRAEGMEDGKAVPEKLALLPTVIVGRGPGGWENRETQRRVSFFLSFFLSCVPPVQSMS